MNNILVVVVAAEPTEGRALNYLLGIELVTPKLSVGAERGINWELYPTRMKHQTLKAVFQKVTQPLALPY
jgi:hypothetical protein